MCCLIANFSKFLFWTIFLTNILSIVIGSRNVNHIEFPLQSGKVNGPNGTRMVIVDTSGSRVKLACVNWSGAQLEGYVVNGLDKQPLKFIVDKIAALGFNCIRLVNSMDVIYKNPVIDPERLSANPDLVGKTAMEIHDEVVKVLTEANLMVIINNHMSNAGWCCSLEDGNGMWYTPEYPEEVFFEHWTFMAERYLDNPLVIGADLRNEVRYIEDENVPGGVRYATWGLGIETLDFNTAAEKAALRVHEANPNMLIIVGGIVGGGFLGPAYIAPIRVPNQAKLVYTGHIYPFTPVIADLPYDEFEYTMNVIQTFVEKAGHEYSAPFWMGEFGGGSDSENYQKIFRLLKEHDLDWAYWCIDGYQFGRGDNEGYGLFENDFSTIRHPWKIDQLQEIMPVLS